MMSGTSPTDIMSWWWMTVPQTERTILQGNMHVPFAIRLIGVWAPRSLQVLDTRCCREQTVLFILTLTDSTTRLKYGVLLTRSRQANTMWFSVQGIWTATLRHSRRNILFIGLRAYFKTP